MTNYNYNGMNAYDIANKMIAKEESYMNACYDLMPFEVKCQYAMELTPILHLAVSPDCKRRRELLDELRPELLRRADEEDPFALYVLGNTNADLSAKPTEEDRRFLERSMNAGYIPAALALFNLFYDHGENRSCPEAERVLSWLSERMDEQTPDRYRYGYYSLLNDKDKTRELALRFALDGDFGAAVRLSNHHGSASYMGSDEHVFWMTVLFLVTEHFYNQGAKHLGDRLGMKLIGERGCERDLAKIKEIYVDLMMNAPYNRRTLLSIVGALCNEGGEHLDVAERSCRRLISNGEKSNYWKLILIALLSGDRSKLESACEEACAASAVGHIGKAYLMLRHARAKA